MGDSDGKAPRKQGAPRQDATALTITADARSLRIVSQKIHDALATVDEAAAQKVRFLATELIVQSVRATNDPTTELVLDIEVLPQSVLVRASGGVPLPTLGAVTTDGVSALGRVTANVVAELADSWGSVDGHLWFEIGRDGVD